MNKREKELLDLEELCQYILSEYFKDCIKNTDLHSLYPDRRDTKSHIYWLQIAFGCLTNNQKLKAVQAKPLLCDYVEVDPKHIFMVL